MPPSVAIDRSQALPGLRQSPDIPSKLPTKQYPHLKELINEVEFKCGNCTSATGAPVYRTFKEAYRSPLSGPGEATTRFLLLCPICMTTPKEGCGGRLMEGIVDLLSFPKGYKAPKHESVATGRPALSFDDDDVDVQQAHLPKSEKIKSKTIKKKDTDLSKPKRKYTRRQVPELIES